MNHTRFLYCFNDTQHFRRFLIGLAVLAFFTGIGAVLIPQAWALGAYCTGPSGNMFTQDTITNTISNNTGTDYTIPEPGTTETGGDVQSNFTNACLSTAGDPLGVAGRVLCFFKSSIGQIVTTMYCNFQNKLTGPGSALPIALELFIVIFGIAIVTGMSKFTLREGMVAIFKIALVWTFAANSDWGIGIAYNFFIGFAEEGSNIVLGAAAPGSGGGQLLTQPDSVIQNVFNLISTGAVAASMPASLSALGSTCGVWLFSLLMLLMIFMPMIAGFIVVMILQYLTLYARAILGYLTALVLISFLFILSPLFISFALFKVTRPMFEQWLKYLTSYSLQMIIVFSFLAMLSLIPIGAFFYEILGLLRTVDIMQKSNHSPMTSTICSVCSYTIDAGLNLTAGGAPPITCDGTIDPTTGTQAVIPLMKLPLEQNLIQALLAQIVSLWIIGIVMKDFIKNVPAFASELTGRLQSASLLGGTIQGFASSGNAALTYLGLDELETGIEALGEKISSLGEGRSQTWNRLAPAAGFAALGMLASSMFRKNQGQGSSASGMSGGQLSSPGFFTRDGFFSGGNASATTTNPLSSASFFSRDGFFSVGNSSAAPTDALSSASFFSSNGFFRPALNSSDTSHTSSDYFFKPSDGGGSHTSSDYFFKPSSDGNSSHTSSDYFFKSSGGASGSHTSSDYFFKSSGGTGGGGHISSDYFFKSTGGTGGGGHLSSDGFFKPGGNAKDDDHPYSGHLSSAGFFRPGSVINSRAAVEQSYNNVQQALQDVEIASTMGMNNPNALFMAVQKLQDASDTYDAAASNYYESQQMLLRGRLGMQGGKPPGAAGNAAPGTQGAGPNLTITQMNNMVDEQLQYLQMQVNVKQILGSDDSLTYARDSISEAIDNRFKANTAEDLQNVLGQLYDVEKSMAGGKNILAYSDGAADAAAADDTAADTAPYHPTAGYDTPNITSRELLAASHAHDSSGTADNQSAGDRLRELTSSSYSEAASSTDDGPSDFSGPSGGQADSNTQIINYANEFDDDSSHHKSHSHAHPKVAKQSSDDGSDDDKNS